MSCQDEQQLMLYVDGELADGAQAELESHLDACPRCRRRVLALRSEVDLIAAVLQEPDPAVAAARVSRAGPWAWAALTTAAMVAGARAGMDLFSELGTRLGWLGGIIEQQQISAVFALLFGTQEEDIVMLFTRVAGLASVLLLSGLFVSMARRRRLATAAALLLLALASVPASATEFRHPEPAQGQIVVIPSGETINDTVVAAGKQVIVDGKVTGDLIAVAEQVRVNGEVGGSLLALARTVNLDGTVKGDVYTAGQIVDVRGQVERNLTAAANTLDVASGARVATDAWLASQFGSVNGTIGRDLHAAGQSFSLTGAVDRALRFSGQELSLGQTARVGGEITANVPGASAVVRAPSARLASEPRIHTTAAGSKVHGPRHSAARWLTSRFYFWQGVRVVAALALGLLLYWVVPSLFAWATPPQRHLLRNGGIGFLALVAAPIAAIVVSLTVIGLPIGILTFVLWLAALYLSGIFVAAMLGQLLLRSQGGNGAAFALALLIGLVIVRLAVNLPFLGGWIELLVIIVGLGMLVAQLVQISRQLRAPVTA